jgi:hypothetical protein
VNRGAISKDQVLAFNTPQPACEACSDSQFEVEGLSRLDRDLAENLTLLKVEKCPASVHGGEPTSTSLYQHWLAAKKRVKAHELAWAPAGR